MILYRNTDEAPDADPDPIDVKEAENARFEFEQWKKEQIAENKKRTTEINNTPHISKSDAMELSLCVLKILFLSDSNKFEKDDSFISHIRIDKDFREWYEDEYLVEYNRVKWYLLD